jgi:site-specific recombinase XerD
MERALEPFEQWMRTQRYRESTVRRTAQEVRRARADLASGRQLGPYDAGRRAALARYLAFADAAERRSSRATDELATALERAGVRAATPKLHEPRHKTDRRSFADSDWSRLARATQSDRTPEGHVLFALACSGLRIGDVLRIEVAALREGLQRGALLAERKGGHVLPLPLEGAREAWQRLYDAMESEKHDGNVAGWVLGQHLASPLAGDAAYQRVRRRLLSTAKLLDVEGRVYLHRMRRTIAVQALRITKDMKQVQSLLGHLSLASTDEYVDEIRQNDVARLQHKLGRFREGHG